MAEKLRGRVLVIGSLNLDFVIRAQIPIPGQTVLGSNFSKRAGGKGANQAVAAARISCNVWMAGCIGNDQEGSELFEVIESNDVFLGHVAKIDKSTGVAFVILDNSGENSILVIPGANFSLQIQDIRLAIADCKPDVIVFQGETNMDIVNLVLSDLTISAKKILNLAPAQKLGSHLLSFVDTLIVNEHEATELLDEAPGKDLTYYGKKLLSLSKRVILTLGADGIVLCEPNNIRSLPAFHVESVVDTTGAGDAFVGSFAAFMASGFHFQESARRAIEFSGIAVSREGGIESFPSIHELSFFN